MLTIDPHPLLDLRCFITAFPAPLEAQPSPDWLLALLSLSASAPLQSSDAIREAVRGLLRKGGFKPTGRSKPASEYLIRAVSDGVLEGINLAVDACNVVSLHSGLPISVVDLDLTQGALRVGVAAEGAEYVFNLGGQVIDVSKLLCLHDALGPCGSPVKDSQRTKTHAGTRRTLTLIWGTTACPGLAGKTEAWYRELLEKAGAQTSDLPG